MAESAATIQEPMVIPNVSEHSVPDAGIASLLEGVTGWQMLSLAKGENLFIQGSPADSIFFVREGNVKLSVVSVEGSQAVVALLNAPGFLGEECLAGQALRTSSATTLGPATVYRIRKQAMLQAVHDRPELCAAFVNSLLSRAAGLEEDLCNQLFNPSDKRLAWILVKLARVASCGSMPDVSIPRLNHETLAEMVGTTRSRISVFMNKFKTLKMIEYDVRGDITVRTEMLMDFVLDG